MLGVKIDPHGTRRVKINSKAFLVITTFMEIVAIYAIYTTTNYLIVAICTSFLIDLL